MNNTPYTNQYGYCYQDSNLAEARNTYYGDWTAATYLADTQLPLVAPQEDFGGFGPAQAQFGHCPDGLVPTGMEMDGAWPLQPAPAFKPIGCDGYGDVPQFFGGELAGYDAGKAFGGYYGADMDTDCWQEDLVSSCQTSPFIDQSRLPFQTTAPFQPLSPITPGGSPLPQSSSSCCSNSGGSNSSSSSASSSGTPPPAFLMVPVSNNGHYQYSAYPVPMDSCYLGPMTYQSIAFESQTLPPPPPSPFAIPSLTASPLSTEEVPRIPEQEEEEEEGEEEEEEEEEGLGEEEGEEEGQEGGSEDEEDEDEDVDEEKEKEDDRSVIPNYGNKELRGMGLYDDTPDLVYSGCWTPVGRSPVTPHDQLRPTLGKGLVLEQSFGLPERMMIKNAKTGEIVEGKLRIDEDEDEDMY